jgi:hypothetical protein
VQTARLICSQPCTAKNSPAATTFGKMPSITAFAAASLEAEPRRCPMISLVEQPTRKISPLFGFAEPSKISTAAPACLVSSE